MRLRITGRLPALRLSPRGGHRLRLFAGESSGNSTNKSDYLMVRNRRIPSFDELTQREESMTTIKAMRLASVVTAINVLVASGFSIVGIIRPQYLVPVESVPTQASLLLAMYAAARTIPLALFALGAIYKQATPALLLLGALAGAMQLLDAGIGLFEHDLGKCAGPLFIAVLQFFVVYLLHRSVRITPQTKRG